MIFLAFILVPWLFSSCFLSYFLSYSLVISHSS